MKLSDLIIGLMLLPPDKKVTGGFIHQGTMEVCAYRHDSSAVAFRPAGATETTIGEMLGIAKRAEQSRVPMYSGGMLDVRPETLCYLALPGDVGRLISPDDLVSWARGTDVLQPPESPAPGAPAPEESPAGMSPADPRPHFAPAVAAVASAKTTATPRLPPSGAFSLSYHPAAPVVTARFIGPMMSVEVVLNMAAAQMILDHATRANALWMPWLLERFRYVSEAVMICKKCETEITGTTENPLVPAAADHANACGDAVELSAEVKALYDARPRSESPAS